MGKIVIYGYSDDLLEVEGTVSEEYNAYACDRETGYLAVSDGHCFSVSYTGFWRIAPISLGTSIMEKHEATDEDEDYSDRITLTGDIKWVIFSMEKPAMVKRQ